MTKNTSLSSKLFRARSSVEGEGVFTREHIPEGAHVLDCNGVLLSSEEAERAPDSLRVMQVGPDTYLAEDPDNPGFDDFLNHSCEPNIGFRRGSLALHALRDIAAGEELLFDYSTCMNEPGWEIACACGAPRCRGVIRSYCDMSTREQDDLRGITLAYLTAPAAKAVSAAGSRKR